MTGNSRSFSSSNETRPSRTVKKEEYGSRKAIRGGKRNLHHGIQLCSWIMLERIRRGTDKRKTALICFHYRGQTDVLGEDDTCNFNVEQFLFAIFVTLSVRQSSFHHPFFCEDVLFQ